jgi:hypothetical protein
MESIISHFARGTDMHHLAFVVGVILIAIGNVWK